MICCDNQPFSIVENMGFKNFVNTLAPGTKIKSRYFYSSKGLDLLVTNLEERVKLDLKNAEELSMTSDGWSSQDKKHSLLSLTAHWIHKETFQPCFAVLGSMSVYGRHTAINFSHGSTILVDSRYICGIRKIVQCIGPHLYPEKKSIE